MSRRILLAAFLAAPISSFAGAPRCLLLDDVGISGRQALLEGSSVSKTPKGWKVGGSRIVVRWGTDFEGSPRDTLAGPLEVRAVTESDQPGVARVGAISKSPDVPLSIGGQDEFSDPPSGCRTGAFTIVGTPELRLDRRFPLPRELGRITVEKGELVARKPATLGGSRISYAVLDRTGTVLLGRSPEPWRRLMDGSVEIVAPGGIDFLGTVPDVARAPSLSVRMLPRYGDSLRCGVADSRLWNWADSSGAPLAVARSVRMRKVGETWVSERAVKAKWGFATLEGTLRVRNWTENDDGGQARVLVALVDPTVSTTWSPGRKVPGEVFLPDEGWRNRAAALGQDTLRGDLPDGKGRFFVADSLVLARLPGMGRCPEGPLGFLDKHLRLERDGVVLAPWYRKTVVGRMSFFPWPSGLDPVGGDAPGVTRWWESVPSVVDTATWRDLPGIGRFRPTGEIGSPSGDSVDIRVLVALDSSWARWFEVDTFPMVHRTAWSRKIAPGPTPRLVASSQFLAGRIGDFDAGISGIEAMSTVAIQGRSTFLVQGTKLYAWQPGEKKGSIEPVASCTLDTALRCLPPQGGLPTR